MISCKEKPSEKVIAIYIQNYKYEKQDILVIGKISKDSIVKITDWDDSKKKQVVNRKPYLKKYPNYYISHNDSITKISVNKILKKEFQCNTLTVGNSNEYYLNINNDFSLATNHSDFKNFLKHEDIDVNYKVLGLISSKMQKAFGQNEISLIDYDEENIFNSTSKDFSTKILQSIDLNNDGDNEFIIKGTVENQDGYGSESVFLILTVTENYIKEIGSIKSWRSGYNLIGITDLNNNGKLELTFQGAGYESIGFEIYEINKNGIKKLLHTIPYGC